MASLLKKAVFNLVEKTFIDRGQVVGIRKWKPGTICEIDLHLPEVDMSKWNTIHRLKCKVGECEYRDYTPATWDSQKRVCTVIVEAEHLGCGSAWVKQLQVGDTVLLGPAHAAQLPSRTGKILCLGDGSAIGHFMALKQLTNQNEYPMEAIIFLKEVYSLPNHWVAANPEFKFIMTQHAHPLETLLVYAEKKELADYTSIYLAGNIPMVTGLRKVLKKNPTLQAKVFAHGFWS